MKRRYWLILFFSLILVAGLGYVLSRKYSLNTSYEVGQAIDSLHGVKVYYNGSVRHVEGRNLTPDNYNLGQKYQCVEFVKRYYYQRLHHKMPDPSGDAKDFYENGLSDGERNTKRNLIQFNNGSATCPDTSDLLVFGPSLFNPFGHVAIVSDVTGLELELIQQNPGPFGKSRVRIGIRSENGRWYLAESRVLGWLRLRKAD